MSCDYSTLTNFKLTFRFGFHFVWASLILSLLNFIFFLRHLNLWLIKGFGTPTRHRAHNIINLRATIAIAFLCKWLIWWACNFYVFFLISNMFIAILQIWLVILRERCNYEFFCVWVSWSFIHHVKEHTHNFFSYKRNWPWKHIHLIWKNKGMLCTAVLFYI